MLTLAFSFLFFSSALWCVPTTRPDIRDTPGHRILRPPGALVDKSTVKTCAITYITYTLMVGLFFFSFPVLAGVPCSARLCRVSLRVISDNRRVVCDTLCTHVVTFFGLLCMVVTTASSFLFPCQETMARWFRHLEHLWIPCGDNFKKGLRGRMRTRGPRLRTL